MKMHRYVRRGLAAAALLVVGLAVGSTWKHGRTPAIDSPDSISRLDAIRINGVEQHVLIRGRDRTKPVLLFLHGGPGMPAMFLAHAFQRPFENDYVVVQWDRRGAGKSFDAGRLGPPPTVRQTLDDTHELTQLLRARFGQPKIYLVGHSWGSYLGLLAAREHPEHYWAFIGTGQIAGSRQQVRAVRRTFAVRAAQAGRGAGTAAAGATADQDLSEDELFRLGGELHAHRSFWPLLLTGLRSPEYTLRDVLNVKRGVDTVNRLMKYDVAPGLFEGEVDRLDLPVFFFLGRHDLNTPACLAAEYLERLEAPLKGTAWFERSAHFPFFEEPELFHRELLRSEAATRRYWSERAGG